MKGNTPEERATELQKMKSSSRRFLRVSRCWDYRYMCEILPHKPSRSALLEVFLKLGFLVENQPREADTDSIDASTSEATARSPAPTAAVSSEPDSGSSPSSSDEDAGTSDRTSQKDHPVVTTTVRFKIKDAGLYKKFSNDDELIVGFIKYLSNDRNVTNYKTKVDNVSRFLRFMQPTGDFATLDFLTKTTETRDFLNALKSTGLCQRTVCYFIKNILQFVEYLRNGLDVAASNSTLQSQCQAYKELVHTLKKAMLGTDSKLSTKHMPFVDDKRSLRECQEVLRVAKTDFLKTFRKCVSDQSCSKVSENELTNFRYYCEAILVLRHFQPPAVVEEMTVQQWIERKPFDNSLVIVVSDHKTPSSLLGTFAITQEEEAWFDAYYRYIRPEYINDPCDHFFLSTKRLKVWSVTSDLRRLHTSYKVKNTNSREVRRIARTEVDLSCSDRQKRDVACYMAHTTGATPPRHSESLTPARVAQTSVLLAKLTDQSHETSPRQEALVSARGYEDFTASFPVTNDGEPPTKKVRVAAGFPDNCIFYNKWRGEQYNKRSKQLLSYFKTRKPLPMVVSEYIGKQGWKCNHPTVDEFLKMWKKAVIDKNEDDKHVLKSVITQKWKGVSFKDFGEKKGVVATMPFSEGDIVCDFHGEIITANIGNQMMGTRMDKASHMLFFTTQDKDLCIDTRLCKCHPGMDTVGRWINRSSKKPNLRPFHRVLSIDGKVSNVILLKALRDVNVDEELSFQLHHPADSLEEEVLSDDAEEM
ncbi:uncharacterized protein si:dkey-23a23.2 isoform X2 [Pungitius pungitius]